MLESPPRRQFAGESRRNAGIKLHLACLFQTISLKSHAYMLTPVPIGLLDGCRLGAYLLLSALTCIALDLVTGPQRVARVPDPEQLQEVRAAAEKRRNAARLQLRRAAERAMRRKSATSSVGEYNRAQISEVTSVHGDQHVAGVQKACAR